MNTKTSDNSVDFISREGEPRFFSIGAILCITTGVFCTDDFKDVYEILNYMTGDNLHTAQLGYSAEEAIPYLLEQYPQLRHITADMLTSTDTWETKYKFQVERARERFGDFFLLWSMHKKDHTVTDPVEHLRGLLRDDQQLLEIDMRTKRIGFDDLDWKE